MEGQMRMDRLSSATSSRRRCTHEANELGSRLKALVAGQQRLEEALERIGSDVKLIAENQEAFQDQLREAKEQTSGPTLSTAAQVSDVNGLVSDGSPYSPAFASAQHDLAEQLEARVRFTRSNHRSDSSMVQRRPASERKLSFLRPRAFESDAHSFPLARSSRQLTTSLTNQVRACSRYRYVLRSDSVISMALDICTMVIMLSDILVVPFTLAWSLDPPGSSVLGVLTWTSIIYWSLDMALSFFKTIPAEEHAEETETDTWNQVGWMVVRRYMRSWFLLDFCLVFGDWFGVIWEATGEDSTTPVYRLVRLLRILRLVRAWKIWYAKHLSRIFDQPMFAWFMFSNMRIVGKVVNLLLFGMIVNHWCGCIWYSIAQDGYSNTGNSWLIEHDFTDASTLQQYLVAFQWAVAHMFGGNPIVFPQNSLEILWAIVDLVIGVLFGSVLISTIASMMIEIHMERDIQVKQQEEAQRFLQSRKVDFRLAVRILKQIQIRCEAKSRPTLQDVPSLPAHLPPALLAELHFELFAAEVLKKEFLYLFGHIDEELIPILCTKCIRQINVVAQDELFSPNQAAEAAYILTSGTLKYESLIQPVDVEVGSWLAEQALWLAWSFVGWCEAVTSSELLAINAEEFERILTCSPKLCAIAKNYAGTVLDHLYQVERSDLTDLPMEQDDILLKLPAETRIALSKIALRQLENDRSSHWVFWQRTDLAELEEEIEQGDCMLRVNITGRYTRVVSEVKLLLLSPDGRQLVKMGEVSTARDQEPIVYCDHPTITVRPEELRQDAAQRLIQEKLTMLADDILIPIHSEDTTEEHQENGLFMRRYESFFQATMNQAHSEPAGRALLIKATSHMRSLTSAAGSYYRRAATLSSLSVMLSTFTPGTDDQVDGPWDPEHNHNAFELCARSGQSISVYAWLTNCELHHAKERQAGVQTWLSSLSLAYEDQGGIRSPSSPEVVCEVIYDGKSI